MRWSEAFIPTLREDPKDAEAISHTRMVQWSEVGVVAAGVSTNVA